MNIAIYNYYKEFNIQNALFNSVSFLLGSDLAFPFILLKSELEKTGNKINTLDIYQDESIDKIIFLDFPSDNLELLQNCKKKNIEMYLIIFECEIIKPDNWNLDNHFWFTKIFTWNNEYIDNNRYFKYFWPNKIIGSHFTLTDRRFCTLIASNKNNSDKRELYSYRVDAIKWFEKKHSSNFDLYGFGWDQGVKEKIIKNNFLYKCYRRIFKLFQNSSINRIYFPKTYKGKVKNKIEVLKKYKYCICFENAIIPGYITEKIFDCFLAYTIPIYYGDPNILNYIPSSCFIDMRNFKNFKLLYSYIANLSDSQYFSYITSISSFLLSDEIKKFSAENFSKTLISEIC